MTDDGPPTSIDQFIPGLYRTPATVSGCRRPTPDTWNLERPACFEIVPTAARSGAIRQICTARDHAILRRRAYARQNCSACLRTNCDDALTREYREIVRRPGFSSKAEPGAISSSRCQTTRTRPGEPGRVRNDLLLDEPRAARGNTHKTEESSSARNRGIKRIDQSAATADLVEPDGIEPTTSCLQSRRSPN
jgi:hypothetical protein